MTAVSTPIKPHLAQGRMSEDEFIDWCDSKTWAEWVDGEIILMSPVNTEHGDLFSFLFTLIRNFVDEHDLGKVYSEPVQTRLAKIPSRRSPDMFFVAANRLEIIKKPHVDGPPDLIVEIISPDSQNRDRREKFLEYEQSGVREYWIVDPLSKTVEAFTLIDKKYRPVQGKTAIKSLVLPGFAIKPAWLWREKLPKVSACLREMRSIKS